MAIQNQTPKYTFHHTNLLIMANYVKITYSLSFQKNKIAGGLRKWLKRATSLKLKLELEDIQQVEVN